MKRELGIPFSINLDDIVDCSTEEKAQICTLLAICFLIFITTLFLIAYNFVIVTDYISFVTGTQHINPAMSFLFGVHIYAFVSRLPWFRINAQTIYDICIMHISALCSMIVLFIGLHIFFLT